MDRQTPRRIKTHAWIEDAETDRPSQTSQTYRAGAATLSETLRPETTARGSRIPWADIPPKTPGCWASWSAPHQGHTCFLPLSHTVWAGSRTCRSTEDGQRSLGGGSTRKWANAVAEATRAL